MGLKWIKISEYHLRKNHFWLLHHCKDYLNKNLLSTWWRHQMETFSALLAICAGNSPVPGEFPAQRPVTRSFDVFFDLRLNKRLSKQPWGWWFETPAWSLWRHRNDIKINKKHSKGVTPPPRLVWEVWNGLVKHETIQSIVPRGLASQLQNIPFCYLCDVRKLHGIHSFAFPQCC